MHRIRTLLILFVLVGLLVPASDAWASKTLGVALAWELSEKLKSQQIRLPEALARLDDLETDELDKFLETWRVVAPPLLVSAKITERAEELRAGVEATPGAEPQLEPVAEPPPKTYRRSVVVSDGTYQQDSKSVGVSLLLATVLGFGIGDLYAEAYWTAGVMSVTQVTSLVTALATDGFAEGFFALSFVLLRVFEIGSAIYWTNDYNYELRKKLGSQEDLERVNPPDSPGAFTFPLLQATW